MSRLVRTPRPAPRSPTSPIRGGHASSWSSGADVIRARASTLPDRYPPSAGLVRDVPRARTSQRRRTEVSIRSIGSTEFRESDSAKGEHPAQEVLTASVLLRIHRSLFQFGTLLHPGSLVGYGTLIEIGSLLSLGTLVQANGVALDRAPRAGRHRCHAADLNADSAKECQVLNG